MKIYISGPMADHPNLNYPAFDAEAARLRALGYQVINPAENNCEGMTWAAAKRRDLAQMMGCDAIVQLLGWEKSKGGNLEYHCARELSMHVLRAGEVMPAPLALVGRAA